MSNQTKIPSLAQHIARFSTGLLLVFIIVLGGSSWFLIRSEQAQAHRQLLEKEMELHANRVSTLLQTIHGQLKKTAGSSLISTALVDSAGKDAYLAPYLQGLRRVEGVPVTLVFADFEGKEIARNGIPGFTEEHFAWLTGVLSDPSLPSAIIRGTGEAAELLVAERIYYSRTRTPEGALMYRLKLSDLAEPAAPLHWKGDGFAPPPERLWQVLKVPEDFKDLGLTMVLNDSTVVPPQGIQLFVLYFVASLLATGLAFWASRRLGLHLTQDLQRLSDFSSRVVGQGFGDERASQRGTREVMQLAEAINGMLDRLNEQHRLLQEESEAKFRNLVENIPGAAYRCHLDGRLSLAYLSPGFEELTGYPADAFIGETGRAYAEIIHPDDRDLRRISDELPTHVFEYRILDAHGNLRWLWERSRIARDGEGRATFLEGVLFDITDRRLNEEALMVAKQLAESANRAKSQFLTTMSHELRTPMNGILGMAQLLTLPDLTPDERLEYATTVIDSGQTLLALLNDILDLSRIEAGKLDLNPGPCFPERIIQEISDLFAAPARNKSLYLKTEINFKQGQGYSGDSLRLRQMLANLANNAVKFTDQGDITIGGQEIARDDASALLEFFVADTGIGIPLDKQAMLFEPFSQVDSSNTRRHGGSGLGLSIIQKLAEIMGGSAGFESEPGRGSRFWFRVRVSLLADTDRASATPLPSATPPALTEDKPATRSRVIHLVEDNQTNRKVIEAMLRKRDMQVIAFENGQLASEAILRGDRPDLILMDCQMPVMDGFEATAAIRNWEQTAGRPRLPIVALTAGAFAEDRERCLAAGMDDFLTKPVNIAKLLAAIERWAPAKQP